MKDNSKVGIGLYKEKRKVYKGLNFISLLNKDLRRDIHLGIDLFIDYGTNLYAPLDGKVKIKVPEGTQTGKLFRLKGKGVGQVRGGSIGDLLCRVVIETPQKLDSKQKALLKELGSSLKESKNTPISSAWFSKVKSFFDGN